MNITLRGLIYLCMFVLTRFESLPECRKHCDLYSATSRSQNEEYQSIYSQWDLIHIFESQKNIILYFLLERILIVVAGPSFHLLQINHKQACAFDNVVGCICGKRLQNY